MTEMPKNCLSVFEDLEKELLQAIQLDELQKLRNEAKFRAVHQNVQSYEEFKEIVNAAHLQPLKKAELQSLRTPKPATWNCLASSQASAQQVKDFVDGRDNQMYTMPQTHQECLKTWQKGKLEDAGRFQMLKTIKTEWLTCILMLETSSGSVGNILKAQLCSEDTPEDVKFVSQLLIAMSEMPRFELAMDFLAKEEKENGKQLLELLRERMHMVESTRIIFDELKNKYSRLYA